MKIEKRSISSDAFRHFANKCESLAIENAELRALCEKMYQVLVDVELYCDSESLCRRVDVMLNEVDQWRKDNE